MSPGAAGIEPAVPVLETGGLPINRRSFALQKLLSEPQLPITLLRLLMENMLSTKRTKLTPL